MITSPIVSTPTPATSATGTGSTGSSDISALGSNINTFLTLLTTQLQHQDPTSPMDTAQFTQQLRQGQNCRGLAGAADMIVTDTQHGYAGVKTLALQSVAGDQAIDGAERHQKLRHP